MTNTTTSNFVFANERRNADILIEHAYNRADAMGAEILDLDFINWECMVVLAELRGEFVTWKTNGNGFYHGHYMSCDLEALEDYKTRLNG